MAKAKKKIKNLTQKQLDYYKQLLLEKMKEILVDVGQMEETVFQGGGELSTMPVHLADMGTDSYEQEFNLGLMAEERKTLIEIQQCWPAFKTGPSAFAKAWAPRSRPIDWRPFPGPATAWSTPR